MPSYGQGHPVKFPLCEFSILCKSCTTADKATVRFHNNRFHRNMNFHTKHYCLLTVKWVSFSHHINCLLANILTDMGHLLRLLSGKLLHTWKQQWIKCTWTCFDHMTVADTIHSKKPEDHDITEKLLQMLLVTTEVLWMQLETFHFHTGKI